MKTASNQSQEFQAIGRRKTSTARVILRPGSGEITINGRPLDAYFGRETSKMIVEQPLVAVGFRHGKFDIVATVRGGGITGQAGALRHAISRALLKFDMEGSTQAEGALGLKKVLRGLGCVTRDSRQVERKKVGLRGARRRRQFSKR